jgi:hypothetical protein
MSLIVVLRNTSDLAPFSDYEYKVLVGDGGPDSKVLETGVVRGHYRDDGWEELMKKFMRERYTQQNLASKLESSKNVVKAKVKDV